MRTTIRATMTDPNRDQEPNTDGPPVLESAPPSKDAEFDDPTGEPRPSPAVPQRRSGALTLLALAVALFAVAGTGFLWWQYRQFYVSLADADADTAAALERIRAAQRSSADRMAELDTALRSHDQSLRELDARLDAVPGQLADVQTRIDALQGGSFDARAKWLVAEAEHYLALANAELELAGNWETARAALELADDRLREIADPSLGSIRDLVADEIIALNSVRLVDTEGLSFSLGRLAERVEELPLRREAPERYASDAGRAEAEPGFDRLWQSVKEAFSSIVRVERGDDVAMALSAEEGRLARRQLAAELSIARLALIRGQQDAYLASLRAAHSLLEADFNVLEAEVEGAIALIDELSMLDIAPTMPDISRSLFALRARSGVE